MEVFFKVSFSLDEHPKLPLQTWQRAQEPGAGQGRTSFVPSCHRKDGRAHYPPQSAPGANTALKG